jgi:outer membrane receptor for ferrienterochelin and colicins
MRIENNNFYTLLFLILYSLVSIQIKAQSSARIKIVDENNTTLIGVNISYYSNNTEAKSINYAITDVNGEAIINISKTERITCTYIGYETTAFNLAPYEVKSILMRKQINAIKTVVVTGQLNASSEKESAENIKIISSKSIEEGVFINLRDLLQSQINVSVTEDQILGSNIRMNGLGGENIKILIDGIPVIGRENGNIDLSQILLNNVDHIEIIQGPMSVLYSSDAAGGVINVITKKQSKKKFLLGLNSNFQSPSSLQTDFNMFYQMKQSHLSINGGRNYFDGYPEFTEARVQSWKPNLKYYTGVSYGFKKKNYSAEYKADYFTQTTLNRGNPIVTPYEAYSFDEKYYTTRYGLNTVQDVVIRNDYRLNTTIAYNNYTRSRQMFRKDLTNLDFEKLNSESSADTSIFNSYLTRVLLISNRNDKRFNFQTGIDANYEDASGKKLMFKTQNIFEIAALVQAEWKFTEYVLIKPGLRLNYNSKYKAPLIPSLNIRWNVKNNIVFRTSLARGYRAPSLKELNLNFVDVNHNIHGNENLEAENIWSTNTSLSFSRAINSININITPSLFYNYLSNQIVLALSDSISNYFSYQNIHSTNTYGFNLNTEITTRNTNFTMAYSLTSVNVLNNSTENNSTVTPEFSSALSRSFNKARTVLTINYKNVGISPAFVTNDNGITTKYETEGYNLFDALITQKIIKNNITLTAGVKNLFNINNIATTLNNQGVHSTGGELAIARGRYFTTTIQINFSTTKNKIKTK